MSVLPKSASFVSFFIVFAVLFLCTILLGLNLKKILQSFRIQTIIPSAPSPGKLLHGPLMILYPLLWLLGVLLAIVELLLGSYLDILNPYNGETASQLYRYPDPGSRWWGIPLWLVAGLPIDILRGIVLPEICMPIDQYIRYQYRDNPYFGKVSYHPIWFVKDVIRGTLIPAWIAVAAGIVGYLVVLDILGYVCCQFRKGP
jgi:hypothetical protein